MNIEELVDILSRLALGEEVSVETEIRIKADLSVNAIGGEGSVHATIFFKSDESDDVLFSAAIEKMGFTKEGSDTKGEDLPLKVSDLEIIPGIEQESGWIVSGHG